MDALVCDAAIISICCDLGGVRHGSGVVEGGWSSGWDFVFVDVKCFFMQSNDFAFAKLSQTGLDETAAAGNFLFLRGWEEQKGFEDKQQFPEGIAGVIDWVDVLVVGIEWG